MFLQLKYFGNFNIILQYFLEFVDRRLLNMYTYHI